MSGECFTPSSLEEAGRVLKQVLEQRRFAAILCRCSVNYKGRGSSWSSPGDRLIVVKPSGSIIIHGPQGFKPENWQPDGSTFAVSMSEGRLILVSMRKNPRETLTIEIEKVYSITSIGNPVKGAFYMYMSESEIRDYLKENPQLIEDGLRILEVEKPAGPGYVDLYGIDKNGVNVVIELKRVRAGEDAVKQLLQYLEFLKRKTGRVRGILVAPGFTESAVRLAYTAGVRLVQIDLKSLSDRIASSRRRTRDLTSFF